MLVSPLGYGFLAGSDHDGKAARSYVLDMSGEIKYGLREDFNESDWVGPYILGTISKDDGHVATSEDLAVFDTRTRIFRELTQTTDTFESDPKWSSTNQRLLYIHGNTIAIARLEALGR